MGNDIRNYTMFTTDVHTYFEQENENPISLLMRRMRIPLVTGTATGLLFQFLKGRFETPATFGSIATATLPICGASFLFLGTAHVAKRIRGKDDTLNYVIGVFSTIPIIRNFMPLPHTCSFVFVINYILIVCLCGYRPLKNYPSIDERLDYGIMKSGHNIYTWAPKSLWGPYIDYQAEIKIPSQ